MNTRTRTLQRMKKRASDPPVPKDYKELEERIDERLSQLQRHIDEIQAKIDTLNETLGKRLDETNQSLQALDVLLRARTDRTAWTWLLGRARNEGCDFAGATFSLHWYLQKDKFDALSYADFKKNVQEMVKDTCKEARKEHWLFQGIVVIADWHHKGHRRDDGHHDGYNGSNYHVHILTFGKPKTEVLRYMASWWGNHNLGQYVKHGAHAGTIEYKWSVDYGWYVYLLDNLHGSTKGIGKAITMSTNKYSHHIPRWFTDALKEQETRDLFEGRWDVNDWRWSALMRPIGTFDRGQADGLVAPEDEFIEFDIKG